MSSAKPTVAVRDLVEEAKKRVVFLAICVVGLSYLMSLTSSSVWVNMPAAAILIIIIRYLSLDFEMRRKAAVYNSKPSSANIVAEKKSLEGPKIIERFDWRRKVNSSVVEDAIDQFTRHLVSEWVTDLWYSRITPDKEGPEELVQIMNGVLGEISSRGRNVNLIDLLTRDLINLICTQLELFRVTQGKIVKKKLGSLTIGDRDKELKLILAAENKLHPALFSAEAEHKVLQHLVDGLIVLTFKSEDLQCSFFRYTVRELLACAVIRPVLNLANPRFINERIESVVISATKANKGGTTAPEASQPKSNGSSRISSDHFSRFLDPSVTGVELVQLKNDQSRTAADKTGKDNLNGKHLSKDPLLSIDARSTRSWGPLPSGTLSGDGGSIHHQRSGSEWGDMLDIVSRRKTQVLAPENFENMWTKGRNYKKKEDRFAEQVHQSNFVGKADAVNSLKGTQNTKEKDGMSKVNSPPSSGTVSGCNDPSTTKNLSSCADLNILTHSSDTLYKEDHAHSLMRLEEIETESSSSYTTEDEETSTVTGLDSPVTKVWDGRSNRNVAVSHIHHPLESSEGHNGKKTNKGHIRYQTLTRNRMGRKRSRLSSQKVHVWQEVERTSFLSGDGQDILNCSKGHEKSEDTSDDSETEMSGRVNSGAAASSSTPSTSKSESSNFSAVALQNSLLEDSFLKLRCEVLGANIVKSGSRTFAVYSISVTDINNNSWSIKRRFRHFEELHRRLKEFPEYNLHLPPKHFLSTGLDMPVIHERCNLLDKYLKKLLQLPTISGSIEVWDFLSVDSQTYVFSNSISIIETLSVDLHCKPAEKSNKLPSFAGPLVNPLHSRKAHLGNESEEPPLKTKHNCSEDPGRLTERGTTYSLVEKPVKDYRKLLEDSGSDSDTRVPKNASSFGNLGKKVKEREADYGSQETSDILDAENDSSLPTEWVPPSLSVPILDLVDVIFQLQDGGWIRRKAFWVAKQVLQLGMGDAFDDWLIEKIQLLRRGPVIASVINRIEQILWPDGIFLTKHPKRRKPSPPMSPPLISPHAQHPAQMASPRNDDLQKQQEREQNLAFEELQQQEADRRSKFVYELMIDNAPAAIVGLVGRKEYEKCAKDLYFFLQSSVCLKMLVYDLLELLLLSAFPELDGVFKQLHEERQKFGELKIN